MQRCCSHNGAQLKPFCTLLEQCRSTGQCHGLQQQGVQVCNWREWPSILEAAGGFVSFTL